MCTIIFQKKTVISAGYGLVWIEQTGITAPFTVPQFPFLRTTSQRTLDNINPAFVLSTGPSVAPIPLTPNAGLGQSVFTVNRDLGSGYAQQWNLAVQRVGTRCSECGGVHFLSALKLITLRRGYIRSFVVTRAEPSTIFGSSRHELSKCPTAFTGEVTPNLENTNQVRLPD